MKEKTKTTPFFELTIDSETFETAKRVARYFGSKIGSKKCGFRKTDYAFSRAVNTLVYEKNIRIIPLDGDNDGHIDSAFMELFGTDIPNIDWIEIKSIITCLFGLEETRKNSYDKQIIENLVLGKEVILRLDLSR